MKIEIEELKAEALDWMRKQAKGDQKCNALLQHIEASSIWEMTTAADPFTHLLKSGFGMLGSFEQVYTTQINGNVDSWVHILGYDL